MKNRERKIYRESFNVNLMVKKVYESYNHINLMIQTREKKNISLSLMIQNLYYWENSYSGVSIRVKSITNYHNPTQIVENLNLSPGKNISPNHFPSWKFIYEEQKNTRNCKFSPAPEKLYKIWGKIFSE